MPCGHKGSLTQQRGVRVHVDGLPVALWCLVDLVPDGDVRHLADVLVPPVPAVAVDLVVGKLVQARGVAEVHDGQELVDRGALRGDPAGRAQEAKVVGVLLAVVRHLGEVLAQLVSAFGEDAHGTGGWLRVR
jgi:hypothetical protein